MKKLIAILLILPGMCLAQTSFDKAEQLFLSKKYSEAKALFETIVSKQPSNLKALEYLGDIQGFNGNWAAALVYYEKLKNLKPTEANYYYKYGGVLGMIAKESNKFKALGMIGDIRSSFEKAIQLNPKHIEARWALIELYLQLPAIVGGSESKAVKYSEELLKLSPVDGYLSKGRIAEYFNRYKDAERQYKFAIDTGSSKIGYQKLADLYQNKMKQPEKAKRILAEFDQKNKL